jgi:formamidopyrimidine-DNA glycosylase
MPELPEVETVVRDLRPLLVGQRIAAVRVGRRRLRGAWSKAWNEALIGCRITDVSRRGKWILIALDCDALLVLHLGMTGQLRVFPAGDLVERHTHLRFDLDGQEKELRFRDIRRFGSATFFPQRLDWEGFVTSSRLGPEPFDLDARYWAQALAKTDRNLKAVLLDQRVAAGIGNIYADESLFEARLNPKRPGRDLKPVEAKRLRKAVVGVLHRAIDSRGATIRDYVGGSGLRGGYQERFLVYGRTGEPCRRCRSPIERVRLAGRSTHFCPKCQK